MRTEVWAIDLDQPAAVVARLGAHLDADEVARRATARRAPGARDRYVVAHGALREILAAAHRDDTGRVDASTAAAATVATPRTGNRRWRTRRKCRSACRTRRRSHSSRWRGGARRRCRRRGDPRPAPPREARGPGADARGVPGLARGPACLPHDCLPAQLDRQGGVPQSDRCRARASAADGSGLARRLERARRSPRVATSLRRSPSTARSRRRPSSRPGTRNAGLPWAAAW